MYKQIIFLISSERSGGNLFTRMMDAHSLVCGPAPSHLVRTLLNNEFRYGDLSIDDNWIQVVEDVQLLMESQLGLWKHHFTLQELKGIQNRSVKAIIEYIYAVEAGDNGKNYLFIKENKIYQYFDQLLELFPESKFVHLVRDPRDVVLSFLKSPNHNETLTGAAELWQNEQDQFQNITQQLGDRVVQVKYEDILRDTERELSKVCKMMEIAFEPQMLNFHNTENTIENASRIKDWSNLSKSLLTENSGKYLHELSGDQVKQIEVICQQGMEAYNYEVDATVHTTTKNARIEKSQLSEQEQEIRIKRLNVIKQILSRDSV